MRKKYKYSNLKQETNTSGKVILELMKQRKIKIKPREPKQPTWAVAMEERINKRFDNVESRLDRVETRLDKHDQLFKTLIKANNLKTK